MVVTGQKVSFSGSGGGGAADERGRALAEQTVRNGNKLCGSMVASESESRGGNDEGKGKIIAFSRGEKCNEKEKEFCLFIWTAF